MMENVSCLVDWFAMLHDYQDDGDRWSGKSVEGNAVGTVC